MTHYIERLDPSQLDIVEEGEGFIEVNGGCVILQRDDHGDLHMPGPAAFVLSQLAWYMEMLAQQKEAGKLPEHTESLLYQEALKIVHALKGLHMTRDEDKATPVTPSMVVGTIAWKLLQDSGERSKTVQ